MIKLRLNAKLFACELWVKRVGTFGYKAPFSLSRFKVPVHPGLMIRDEP